jgi:hypothetical protein
MHRRASSLRSPRPRVPASFERSAPPRLEAALLPPLASVARAPRHLMHRRASSLDLSVAASPRRWKRSAPPKIEAASFLPPLASVALAPRRLIHRRASSLRSPCPRVAVSPRRSNARHLPRSSPVGAPSRTELAGVVRADEPGRPPQQVTTQKGRRWPRSRACPRSDSVR